MLGSTILHIRILLKNYFFHLNFLSVFLCPFFVIFANLLLFFITQVILHSFLSCSPLFSQLFFFTIMKAVGFVFCFILFCFVFCLHVLAFRHRVHYAQIYFIFYCFPVTILFFITKLLRFVFVFFLHRLFSYSFPLLSLSYFCSLHSHEIFCNVTE